MIKKGLIIALLLIVLVSFAGAENHYVSQNSAGTGTGDTYANRMSAMTFNSAGKWTSVDNDNDNLIGPGDFVYFSGTITTPMVIKGGGSQGKYITFDGWEGGTCHPVEDGGCGGNAALISTPYAQSSAEAYAGFFIGDLSTYPANRDYLIFQDFEMTGSRGIFSGGVSDPATDKIENIIIRRNHIHDTYQGGIKLTSTPGISYPTSYVDITIGGAPGEGNLIHNVRKEDSESAWNGFWGVDGLVISYNEIGSDSFYQDGQNGIAFFASDGILVEYNEMYRCPQACLAPKEPFNDNMIIRFNNFHDNAYPVPNPYNLGGISISRESNRMVVYGNYIYNSGTHAMRFGKESSNIYAWSNILDTAAQRGFSSYTVTTAAWGCDGCYFTNNVVTNGGNNDGDSDKTGVFLSEIGPNGFVFMNNVFLNNGRGAPGYEQMYLKGADKSRLTLEHNQYYDSRGTVMWIWDTVSSPKSLSEIKSLGYEDDTTANSPGGQIGNPGLNSDFTVANENSAVANTGATISNSILPTITVQGVTYGPGQSGDQYYGFDLALHPSTNFNTFPPSVIMVKQGDYGAWERGAYVYTGGSVPTYQCTGSILPNAIAYDSEESTGLTANTPWTFSATDTSVKCQYHCSTGYSWDGSACVAQAGTCPEGLITSTCLCGGTSYSSGYCCSGTWQSTSCTTTSTEYTILKTTTPPTINGDISEFADANEITLTDSLGTAGHYKFLWDSNYLYVAAEVYDSNLNADLAHQDDDGIYTDDSMEFMFDTANDDGGSLQGDDYKFFVNVNNAQTDSQAFDSSWDSGMNSIVSIGTGTINNNADTDTKHTIEARIPWANWATPINDEVWGMNLVLNDKSDEASYPESVQWSEAGLGVNVPNGWNDVTFSSQTIIPPVTSSCTSGADSDYSNSVSITELINFIGRWKTGDVTITELINAIGEWKAGC